MLTGLSHPQTHAAGCAFGPRVRARVRRVLEPIARPQRVAPYLPNFVRYLAFYGQSPSVPTDHRHGNRQIGWQQDRRF